MDSNIVDQHNHEPEARMTDWDTGRPEELRDDGLHSGETGQPFAEEGRGDSGDDRHDPRLAQEAAAGDEAPVLIERAAHSISRKDIPENVLKVLYRLHRAGYVAYLCGGSVRDLLMGRTPKDFDIATDAHPANIRRLFRNSRIIGRRFRLVHILFQERVVEVSTFRKEPEARAEDDLLVTDDNTFGRPVEDARRRDFTINGLFYNIADFTVLDYVGGIEDIREGLIRVIGDPDVRFREDPVRMMRAVEFAARLDFEIEPRTCDALLRHRTDILKASPARVLEEILELLRRGWSLDAMQLMVETELLEPLLPELHSVLKGGSAPFFWKMLQVLDRSVRMGKKPTDAVFLSVLLLPYVAEQMHADERARGGRLKGGEVLFLIRELLQPATQRFMVPAGMRHEIEQALEALWRMLEPPSDRRSVWRFVFRQNFADALALLELFALASGRYVDSFRQWQTVAQRARRSEEPSRTPPARRRHRRRR
jgi:poly(A) polymerase